MELLYAFMSVFVEEGLKSDGGYPPAGMLLLLLLREGGRQGSEATVGAKANSSSISMGSSLSRRYGRDIALSRTSGGRGEEHGEGSRRTPHPMRNGTNTPVDPLPRKRRKDPPPCRCLVTPTRTLPLNRKRLDSPWFPERNESDSLTTALPKSELA